MNFLDLPSWLLLPLMTLLGFAGGALWALVPALRAAKLVNETISTLLLNYVAPLIVSYFIFGPWRSLDSSAYPQSPEFVAAARLPSFAGTRIHPGLIFGLICLALYGAAMNRTRWGLKMRATGGNAEASRRLGVPVSRYLVIAMTLAGGMAGLAGMAEVSAIQGRLVASLSPGYGLIGFLVAWLAGGDAFGIVIMAFLFAVISSIGDILQITQSTPYAVINLLMALVLFIVLGQRNPTGGPRDEHVLRRGRPVEFGRLRNLAFLRRLGRTGRRARGRRQSRARGVDADRRGGGFRRRLALGKPLCRHCRCRARQFAAPISSLAYLVIERRANQLATGLSLMFFGLGASTLIGRPFVGALVTGLPRIAVAGLGAYDVLVWLVVPIALVLWGLLFRTRWGLALRAVGEDPAAAFAAGRQSEAAAIPGAGAGRIPRGRRRSASLRRGSPKPGTKA